MHVDGNAVKSCTILAVQADGENVLTIEGVADGETLHPVQEAFRDHHGLQCGFCTPGMVMSARRSRRPTTRNADEKDDPRTSSKAISAAAPATRTSSQAIRTPAPRWREDSA